MNEHRLGSSEMAEPNCPIVHGTSPDSVVINPPTHTITNIGPGVVYTVEGPIPSAGKKFDGGKIDLSLIPLVAQEQEALGFMLGEKKYGRYNYLSGLESHRLVAAAMRHIMAWQNGEDLDLESGASHLGHARCCLSMILHCAQVGTLKDTRWTGGKK